jgi:hypothetical protein
MRQSICRGCPACPAAAPPRHPLSMTWSVTGAPTELAGIESKNAAECDIAIALSFPTVEACAARG